MKVKARLEFDPQDHLAIMCLVGEIFDLIPDEITVEGKKVDNKPNKHELLKKHQKKAYDYFDMLAQSSFDNGVAWEKMMASKGIEH